MVAAVREHWLTNRFFMRARTLVWLAIFVFAAMPALTQDGTVSFYSNGLMAIQLVPLPTPAKHAAFLGCIFNGEQKIGFVQPGHFLTLHLSPGHYTFSASMSCKHPAKNSQLPVDLTENVSYFIRVQEVITPIPGQPDRGRLDQVTCMVAHEEAGKAKPTNSKHIAQDFRDRIASTSLLPDCP